MPTARLIWVLLGILAAASAAWADSEKECAKPVPMAQLIADRDKYQGQELWVMAYVTIEFENMTACPSKGETDRHHCLWLQINDGPYKTDNDYARYESKKRIWKQFDRQTILIRATFDKDENGHFNMWPGTLRAVTQIQGAKAGWGFNLNVPMHISKCADR
jgi:hypothetical protein